MLCPIKDNSNTIELTVHTSCYWGLRLTLLLHVIENVILTYDLILKI